MAKKQTVSSKSKTKVAKKPTTTSKRVSKKTPKINKKSSLKISKIAESESAIDVSFATDDQAVTEKPTTATEPIEPDTSEPINSTEPTEPDTPESTEPTESTESDTSELTIEITTPDPDETADDQGQDELSDEVAERLSDQLDEIDKQEQHQATDFLDDEEPTIGAIILTDPEATESDVKPEDPKSPRGRLGLWLSVLIAIILSMSAIWRLMIYQHVSVGSQRFTTETDEQIVRQTIEQIKDRKLSFKLANQPAVELRLGDAGIGVDAEKLTTAIRAQRQLTVGNLLPKPTITIPLLVDYPVLQSVLDEHFKQKLVQPTDAKLTYDKKQNLFLTSPATPGYRVDARRAVADPNQLLTQANPVITVEYQTSDPLIKEADLKTAEVYLNERLKLRINLNHDNKLLYFVDPWDIADWVELKTDPQTKKTTIDFNKQKIQDFIGKTVSPQIARGVVNRKVLVNDKNQIVQVLQEGRRGLGTVNPSDSAERIRQALLNNQNLDVNLNIQEVDFTEERLSVKGLKWIEVNLSKQTTTLYTGDQPVHSFLISSGVHPWPTPTGTFKVWLKNPVQRMRGGTREAGDYYDLPNVRWNTYFNRDIGFHTAYWHNNFGRPMSHGCINMREADAKVVFDFASIGTMVVVRY